MEISYSIESALRNKLRHYFATVFDRMNSACCSRATNRWSKSSKAFLARLGSFPSFWISRRAAARRQSGTMLQFCTRSGDARFCTIRSDRRNLK